jgi:transposase
MRIEYLDDLPVLGRYLLDSELVDFLNTHFPDHGSWQGISGGKVGVGWLMYILSEGDHRLCHVEEWAEKRLQVLGAILEEQPLRKIDFCDDRLGRLLDRYSNDEKWQGFEVAFGQNLLQVYKLSELGVGQKNGPAVIRTDSFNAPQYRTPSDLFRFGYSKHRRADQPFCKVMTASLDSLAMPMATEVVKGSGPDADHYLPVIERVRRILPQMGNLYVGDSQMGSHANRLQIVQNCDYYLCPLNRKQCSLELLHSYLDQIPTSFTELSSIFTEPESKRKAAYFYEINEEKSDEDSGVKWMERRLLVYSPDYAQGLIKSFNNRLDEAEEAVKALVVFKRGRRNPKTLKDLQVRSARILKKLKVEEFFEVKCGETVTKRLVQRYKNREPEWRESVTLHLDMKRKESLIEQKRGRLGWQLYATNVPAGLMSAEAVVRCYRDEYRIEHLFDYLINRDVGLLPIYLNKDNRIKGLIRLLTLAMRFATLVQYQVRKRLAELEEKLKGIYPGNAGRATDQPTTPMLLRAFQGIAIASMETLDGMSVQMPPLNTVQERILQLMDLENLYEQTLTKLKIDQRSFNVRE